MESGNTSESGWSLENCAQIEHDTNAYNLKEEGGGLDFFCFYAYNLVRNKKIKKLYLMRNEHAKNTLFKNTS
jgi:hypothetical protein